MSMFRKIRAVRLDPPMNGLETVGDVMDFLACCGLVVGLGWMLVWPV